MSMEELETLQTELSEQERQQYALRAFSWLVSNYDISEHISNLRVGDIPKLIEQVEAAIVKAVKDFE